jgi:hypothetical protein
MRKNTSFRWRHMTLAGYFRIVHPGDNVPGRIDYGLVLGGVLCGEREQPRDKGVHGGEVQRLHAAWQLHPAERVYHKLPIMLFTGFTTEFS